MVATEKVNDLFKVTLSVIGADCAGHKQASSRVLLLCQLLHVAFGFYFFFLTSVFLNQHGRLLSCFRGRMYSYTHTHTGGFT